MTSPGPFDVERWFVSGRVQGVSYRAFIKRRAENLGLTGWVRNRIDRRVEVVVCGTAESIETLKEAAERGPLLARVKAVDRQRMESDLVLVEDELRSGFFIHETL